MRKSLWIIPFLFAVVGAPNAHAQTYNVVTGFSYTSNPNGVWTYYQNGTAFTDLQGGSNPISTSPGLPGWFNNGGEPDDIVILQNNTGGTVSYLTIQAPTGYLWLDPEGYSASVAFTAPSAGTYTITGNFLGIDSDENSHPVEILDNGVGVWNGTISQFGQDDPFSLVETLNSGGIITFEVGTGSAGCSYCDLSTGLDGVIAESSVTPEPASFFLMASGLLAMGGILRRRIFRI
jgi:hypothetical protein